MPEKEATMPDMVEQDEEVGDEYLFFDPHGKDERQLLSISSQTFEV